MIGVDFGKMLRIIPLGICGFIPTMGRETSSILVLSKNVAVMFDAGTGVKHLYKKSLIKQLDDVDTLHLFLSHFHSDHIVGLTWLLALWKRKLKIYAPSWPLLEINTSNLIYDITSPPLFGLPISSWGNTSVIPISDEGNVVVEHLTVSMLRQSHEGGSVGYRIGDFAYITDTRPSEKHVSFLRDCQLALIDTMYDQEDVQAIQTGQLMAAEHGDSIGNSKLAKTAEIKTLGLIHLNPLYRALRLKKMLKECQSVFSETCYVTENQIYELD
jgi:ribonuclease BN (tRNA processing enzyme)